MPGGGRLPVAAVVVNYNAGAALASCVENLTAEGVAEVLVVDNGSADGSVALLRQSETGFRLIEPGRNLGCGGAANLGARATSEPYLLICNPDLTARPGALAALVKRLDEDDSIGLVGPMLRDRTGEVYPSGREFPGLAGAIGHAFVGLFWGGNPWTRRYRHLGSDQHASREADWVSGAFMVARKLAFDSVGGFDEGYFMYVEDVDLCWRLHRAGWTVWYEPAAAVDHEQGVSTSRHPYRMLLAHHSSMWRFAARTAQGWERALLPLMAVGLAARLLLSWADHLLRPVRDELLARANVGSHARGEFQP